ncbi:MAG TPA: PEP/pyruvate-binding domain-containing protein [Steroidobacteraceae bacterium]|nr:PEP/pyruvate-binding domain-containing protein [Steroidobacteraceae bacterium]
MHVSWFSEIGLGDRPDVGGKGGSLGELQRAGIAVPPGFVVRTQAFEHFLQRLEQDAPLRAQVQSLDPSDLAAITSCSRELRARLEEAPLPQELFEEISRAHERLSSAAGTPVAVRSSATTEDASDASFAGLQDTYLWVRDAQQTLHKVRSCWASLYSVESISYRRQRGFPEQGVAMAVVVQTMVNARTAGVMFTRSPTTGDRSVLTIEGAWGLGSSVVGGEVTPDRWVVAKITGEITVREISDKQIQHVPAAAGGIEAVPVQEELRRLACLSDNELQALRDVARKVERHYGRAQDIEWAVERDSGNLYLLQSRPETVWSARDAAPVAKAADNPLAHVMSIFGGRR